MPAGTLLGPMLVAGALTLSGVEFAVPPVVRELAFALIGLQVGLRFTLETVKLLGRLFLPVLGAVFALLAGCFALAVALTLTTPVSLQDAYLATTPGGLYAVLAVAVGAGVEHDLHPRRAGHAAARRGAAGAARGAPDRRAG